MSIDEDLARALADANLILCVGPEPSLAAGLPDLDGLARRLLDHAITIDASVEQLSLRTWIDQGRAPELLEQLQHRLGAEFQREVERALSDQGRPLPAVVTAIAALRKQLRAIYTTRLDRLLDRGLAGRWPGFHGARADLAQRRSVLFKLRGTLEFPQSWVLTREQEEREFGPGSARRTVLDAAFRAHQILFIGFAVDSLELRRLLDVLPTQTQGQGPAHFIALPECTAPEREQLERRGLRVLESETQALLDALGGQGDGADKPVPTVEQCPFPGLESFREDQAALFFGRHAEISQATTLLGGVGGVDNRWLAIEGPSGVGKSSFARAGVVPALRRGFAEGTPGSWRVATMRPGARPLAHLAEALASALELTDAKRLAEQIATSPRRLTELVRERLGSGEGLVLLVDQLEEIVTLAPESERTPFGEAIARALDARVLYLITTTRSDLVPELQRGLPSLAGLLNELAQRYALPPISRSGLREAICEPASKTGVTIAPELVERILLEADERPTQASDGETLTADAALPLIAHVLRGLWTRSTIADRVLTLDEYLALGGVVGALSRSADTLLATLDARDQDGARDLLLRLIRLQPDGTATRRVLDLDEASELASQRVLARLSGTAGQADQAPSARLLLVRDDQGEAEVEIVHEALIRDWAKFRAWIDEHRARLLLDEDLARQAEKWVSRGRPSNELPTGRDVVELLGARPHGPARARQREFQQALQRHQRRRKLITTGVVATTMLGVVAIVSLALGSRTPTIIEACTFEIDPTITDAVTLSAGQVYETQISSGRNVAFRCPPDSSEGVTVIVNYETGVIGYRPNVLPDAKLGPGDLTPGLPPDLSPDELARVMKFISVSDANATKSNDIVASVEEQGSQPALTTNPAPATPPASEPPPAPAASEPSPAVEPPAAAESVPAAKPQDAKLAIEVDKLHEVGSLHSPKELGPAGTFAAAKSYCAKLDNDKKFGLSQWRMATSTEIGTFKVKNLLYWTKEVDGAKAKTYSTFGGDPWREQTDTNPRAFCVSK